MHPQDKLVWGDMQEYADYGVAAGDVHAAIRLSALLGRMDKESQVRIGSHYSFADLRNSPAIVVGAFNNRWTMQMTSNLHFAFVEEDGTPKMCIRDRICPGTAPRLVRYSLRSHPLPERHELWMREVGTVWRADVPIL